MGTVDRKAFYAQLRKRDSGVFGTSLSQAQVNGTNAILDSCIRHGVCDLWVVALILANVYHETGGYMLPIKETVYRSSKNKNPSDAQVIARLNAAFKRGQLKWVKKVYWREGWFGRGPIQITHKDNYEKMGKRLGVDLVGNRELIMRPDIGADSAVVGMMEGMFTGRKVGDYQLPDDLGNDWETHPRRIVNGKDGTDDKISHYTNVFRLALGLAEYDGKHDAPPQKPVETRQPEPAPDTAQKPKPRSEPNLGAFAAFIRAILKAMGLVK